MVVTYSLFDVIYSPYIFTCSTYKSEITPSLAVVPFCFGEIEAWLGGFSLELLMSTCSLDWVLLIFVPTTPPSLPTLPRFPFAWRLSSPPSLYITFSLEFVPPTQLMFLTLQFYFEVARSRPPTPFASQSRFEVTTLQPSTHQTSILLQPANLLLPSKSSAAIRKRSPSRWMAVLRPQETHLQKLIDTLGIQITVDITQVESIAHVRYRKFKRGSHVGECAAPLLRK